MQITVADAAGSLAQCESNGGEIVRLIREMGGAKMAVIRAPAGAVCARFQPAADDPKSPDFPALQFDPVTADDFEALLAIRTAAMRPSLEPVGRFDPARSRQRLRDSFYPEHTHFIVH